MDVSKIGRNKVFAFRREESEYKYYVTNELDMALRTAYKLKEKRRFVKMQKVCYKFTRWVLFNVFTS